MKEQRDNGAEVEENPRAHPEIPAPKHPETAGAATQAKRRPAYRNLRVWAESFDLALDIFQATRGLTGSGSRHLARRLISASSGMPVAVARGQASGSAREFILSLQGGLSHLSDLETHLLMCAELGKLSTDQVVGYESRIREIRGMAFGLIKRLKTNTGSAGGTDDRQRGSALILAILVTAILGIVGATVLQLADGEMKIAAHGRDRDQLLNVAETGARMVKAWFDQPVSGDPSSAVNIRHALLGRHDPRDPADFDRTRRMIDHDNNPATSRVAADGTTGREFYRQGRSVVSGRPHLDLFSKPYRGGTTLQFLGSESGPDIVLEDRPGVSDLLDEINADLFPDQNTTGRIEKIEIFAPIGSDAVSPTDRLGVATVKVTAARFDRSGRNLAARSVVRMGLAEIPTNAPRGPLESCGDLTALGPLRARWGRVLAAGDVMLPDQLDRLDGFVASAFPYASFGLRISGSASGGDLADWLNDPDDSVEDPWLKVVAGGNLVGWHTLPDQPLPFNQTRSIDLDHSNLFQRAPGITCATFDYDLWKRIAMSGMPGDRHLHYFAFDPGTGLFREGGAGTPRSVRDWTHGRTGIFFFDTADGSRPGSLNRTPPVVISGGDWHTAGLIYLNAVSFAADSVAGVDRVVLPPGEPYDVMDHDGARDGLETYVNLMYGTTIGSGALTDDILKQSVATQNVSAASPDGERYGVATTLQRDPRGLPTLAAVNLFGVLYNSGDIVAEGSVVVYGSLAAGDDVIQVSSSAPTPVIYFDDRLNTGEWPPPEIAMPRTFVTFWQTSRP